MLAQRSILLFILVLKVGSVYSQELLCWKEASDRYFISEHLLKAIGWVESNHNPLAENKISKSRGIMQINPFWFPVIKRRYNIDDKELWNPCVNINVGAWILRQEFDRYGRTWTAVGAYYAGPYKKERLQKYKEDYLEYTQKVAAKLKDYEK